MNKAQIAKKYSKVLINTVDTSDIPKVTKELSAFSKLIDTNRKLKLLFTSQIFSEDERNRALRELLPYLKISSQTEKFLKLIIIHGYLSAIKEIIKVSDSLYDEKLKRVTALVTTPVSLDEIHINRLKTALKTLTRREVEIKSQLDPSLLGGFIVKVGSTVYNSSLRGQLRLLKIELTKQI
jgi:ATP synthase F1 delta subunit